MGRVKGKHRTANLRHFLASKLQDVPSDKVFDEIERTDSTPKRMGETYFQFYNRSARPLMATVRSFIEGCLRKYPEEERYGTRKRLSSRNDNDFESAIFELILHETLASQGCTITPHPTLPNGSNKKPDFLVVTGEGERFYLEATVVGTESAEERGANARRARALDKLNGAPHENFLVLISETGSPLGQPNGEQLSRDVHQWLDSLDVESIYREIQHSIQALPTYRWSAEGWALNIKAWPLPPESRGKSPLLIGGGTIPGSEGNITTSIQRNIKKKAAKYGELDAPLVIAVNVIGGGLIEDHEEEALLGKQVFVIPKGSDYATVQRVRPDGLWYGNGGPKGLRCSAAWVFNNLRVSSLGSTSSNVYFNPWAANPGPSFLESFNYAKIVGFEFVRSEGIEVHEILRLAEGWPRESK